MLHQLVLILSNSAYVMLIYGALEICTGKFPWAASFNDWLVEISIYTLLDLVLHPVAVFATAAFAVYALPQYAGKLSYLPWYVQFAAFLVFEDMVQYWAHRACHTYRKLWIFHLAHHSAPYMGIRMSRRNSFLYLLVLPNQYTAGILVYLGFGDVFVWYTAIKNVVVSGAHSEMRWDLFLYRYKFLHPVAWVIERTISTPATHFAHHAEHEDDGIGHYHGNYGNLLFFWDVLFGTHHITRKYPRTFGVTPHPVYGQKPWYIQIFYPLLRKRIKMPDVKAIGDVMAPQKVKAS